MRSIHLLFTCVCCALIAALAGCADYSPLSDDQLPKPPNLLVDSAFDSTAWLSWSESEAVGFWKYQLYMNQGAEVDSTDSLLYELRDPGKRRAAVRHLDLASTYAFRVYVHTIYDTAAASNPAYAGDRGDIPDDSLAVAPDSVTARVDSAFDGGVILSWSASDDSLFDRYVIVHDSHEQLDTFSMGALSARATDVIVIRERDSVRAQIDSLPALRQRWFAVYVQNKQGRVSPSNVAVNRRLFVKTAVHGDSAVKLTWTKALSPDFYGIFIYRGESSGLSTSGLDMDIVAEIDNQLTLTHIDSSGLKPGNTYFYRLSLHVLADNDDNNGDIAEYLSNESRVSLPEAE
jgi:hypothetical protein